MLGSGMERLGFEEAETEARLVQRIAECSVGAVENGAGVEHYEKASQEVDSFKANLDALGNEDIIGLYEDAWEMQGDSMSYEYVLVDRVSPTEPLERMFWAACYLDPGRAIELHKQVLQSEREEVKARAHIGALTLSKIGDENAITLWRSVFSAEASTDKFRKDARTAAGIALNAVANGAQGFRLSTDSVEELKQLSQ